MGVRVFRFVVGVAPCPSASPADPGMTSLWSILLNGGTVAASLVAAPGMAVARRRLKAELVEMEWVVTHTS